MRIGGFTPVLSRCEMIAGPLMLTRNGVAQHPIPDRCCRFEPDRGQHLESARYGSTFRGNSTLFRHSIELLFCRVPTGTASPSPWSRPRCRTPRPLGSALTGPARLPFSAPLCSPDRAIATQPFAPCALAAKRCLSLPLNASARPAITFLHEFRQRTALSIRTAEPHSQP
jgi:hypothetical protein